MSREMRNLPEAAAVKIKDMELLLDQTFWYLQQLLSLLLIFNRTTIYIRSTIWYIYFTDSIVMESRYVKIT